MKILLLNEDFPPLGKGGGATVCAALAMGYIRAGHDVHVLTTHQTDEPDKTWATDGITVTSLQLSYAPALRPYLSLWNPAAAAKLKTFFAAHAHFNITHAHNVHNHLTYCSLAFAKRVSKRLIMTFHDVMSFSYGRLATDRYLKTGDYHLSMMEQIAQVGITYNPLRNMLIRTYVNKADTKIAVSEALKQALETNGIKIDSVIHNGIDHIQAPHEHMTHLKKQWNLTHEPLIFFGGRLSGDKGFVELLQAFGKIADRFPTAKILVVGDQKKVSSLLSSPELQKLFGNVLFTGWLPHADLLAVLALCDVCVTPSVCFDSFPTINLEAMALAKPVIATHFGGSKELVHDGETGFIVNPLNVTLLSEKLELLLQEPALAKRMGEAGQKRVQEKFTMEQQVQAYMRYFTA